MGQYPFHLLTTILAQYRFGFQGMRKGNQLYGDGNLYETPFRNYDPRLGRWLSPDPIQHPWQGSYTAFNNNPIYFVDPMGLEGDENDGSGGDDDDEQFFGPYGTGVVTVTPDEEGNNRKNKSDNEKQKTQSKPSGVEARIDFLYFKWRMEGDLRGFERIKQVKPGNKLILTGNYADLPELPERIYIGADLSAAVGEGVKFEAQFNWLLEGEDASPFPYLTIEAGAGAGAEDPSADGVLGAQWYTRNRDNYPLIQERLSGGSFYGGGAVQPYPLPVGIAGEVEQGYDRKMQKVIWRGGEIGISTPGAPGGGMAGYNQTLVNIHLRPW